MKHLKTMFPSFCNMATAQSLLICPNAVKIGIRHRSYVRQLAVFTATHKKKWQNNI